MTPSISKQMKTMFGHIWDERPCHPQIPSHFRYPEAAALKVWNHDEPETRGAVSTVAWQMGVWDDKTSWQAAKIEKWSLD